MFSPYFDQDKPEIEITGMIADLDMSQPYELDAAGVFKIKSGGYLVVFVSGCSCWPDRGSTTQIICKRKSDVDKELRGNWTESLDKCHSQKGKPTTETA